MRHLQLKYRHSLSPRTPHTAELANAISYAALYFFQGILGPCKMLKRCAWCIVWGSWWCGSVARSLAPRHCDGRRTA